MSPDSLDMYSQANAGSFNDWHTPILSWAWSLLGVNTFGPILPFVLQQACLWLGVGMISVALSQHVGALSIALPPVVLLFDHIWVTAWIWKDATAAAAVALTLGWAALGWNQKDAGARTLMFAAGTLTAAVVSSTRIYMLPTTLAMATTLLGMCVAEPSFRAGEHAAQKRRKAGLVLAITFALASAAPVLLEKSVVRPTHLYQESAIYLVDLARLQCAGTPGPEVGGTWIPADFVVVGEGKLCDLYKPTTLAPLVFAPDSRTHLRVAVTAMENEQLRAAWIVAAGRHWIELLGARVTLFADFFRTHDEWAIPRLNDQGSPFLGARGAVGVGSTVGWPSAGGAALVATRFPALISDQSVLASGVFRTGIATSIVMPASALYLWWRRLRRVPGWLAVGALVPVMWAANFAVLSPWNDTRYMAPAITWGLLFSTFAALALAPAKDTVVLPADARPHSGA